VPGIDAMKQRGEVITFSEESYASVRFLAGSLAAVVPDENCRFQRLRLDLFQNPLHDFPCAPMREYDGRAHHGSYEQAVLVVA
jgi:hypothetical protein